ncbi:hypothetical protein [Clostridium minihomine]|uniref:hypothetical protein n=1 Tax=Clostridium minihomine TaxID=2045012 RepID=UPI00101AE4B4|nr:hypothetical protein [Clostridium minihomine]
MIFSVLAAALVAGLIVLGFHLSTLNTPTYQKIDPKKTDEGKMLSSLGAINVRENDSFPLSFHFLTNNGSNFEFLNQEEDLEIRTNAKNIRIKEYYIKKSPGENPYVYTLQTSCMVEGTDPVELKELMIQTKTNEYVFDIGKIKIHPYPDNGGLDPDNMKIRSNSALSHNIGIGSYGAEYSNEGTEPAVIKQILIDRNFDFFRPQIYLNDQLISDPLNVNISIPPKESLRLLIRFEKKESPYDVFYFAPAIVLESSTELRPSYAISGIFGVSEAPKILYDKYFKD